VRRHLKSSIYAPLDKTFPTVSGSYIDPALPIYLIVEDSRLDEAVRSLVRIGLDRVEGWAPPDSVDEGTPSDGDEATSTIEEIALASIVSRAEADDALILDVRRRSEYRSGHVPGAVNVAHTRLGEHVSSLPRDRSLLVYCRTGSRSAVASAFLQREGFQAVYVNGMIDDPSLPWIGASPTVPAAQGSSA
jgi:hydroxyacylglutathione hydrolase